MKKLFVLPLTIAALFIAGCSSSDSEKAEDAVEDTFSEVQDAASDALDAAEEVTDDALGENLSAEEMEEALESDDKQ